jgi:glycosyltransferase involved in cell wall biosynthesis
VRFEARGREQFRQAHGLKGKFVVMHSGNHSPCHPLDTLLEAARRLAGERDICFCFIGGGSEFKRIQQRAAEAASRNMLCLPYCPLDELSASLSAADLQVVVMGEPFVGLVHPCKIYNILAVGAPVLYIGPELSHVTEIAELADGEVPWFSARHGDVEAVVNHIRRARAGAAQFSRRQSSRIRARFARETVLPRLLAVLESV